MTTAIGSKITATDVNNLVDSIQNVYATGTGDSGYGQGLYVLGDVSTGRKITAADWACIHGMLAICSNHQGTANTDLFANPNIGDRILSTTSAVAIAASCVANRLRAAPISLSEFDDLVTSAFQSTWNGVVQITADVSFSSEDKARYFFNSGGVIKINLTHPTGSTPQDLSFRSFLARQVGTIYIGAHTTKTGGSAGAFVVPNAGYYEFAQQQTSILTRVSTSYLSTTADQVEVQIQRTGYTGARGGNGAGFQVIILATFMGDASGSVLSAGTSIDVDTVQATKYLNVASPNCAVSGFQQIAVGNSPGGSGPGGGNGNNGGVSTIPPYNPAPGTVTYTVPDYATIMFELKGGGGSQGSSTGPYPRTDGAAIELAVGTDGGDATVAALGLTAKGGKGGGIYDLTNKVAGPVGADGVGTGGDVNTAGGGATGGSGKYAGLDTYFNGSAGGAGAYVKRTYVRGQAGAPNPGDVLTLTVPKGGSQAGITVPTNPLTVFYPGADGANGQVKVTVTKATSGSMSFKTPGSYQFTVPPYSSITFDVKGAGGGQGHDIDEGGFGYLYQGNAVTDMLLAIPVPDGNPGGSSSIPQLKISATGGSGGTYAPYIVTSGFVSFTRVATAVGASGTGVGGQKNTSDGSAGGAIYYFFTPPPSSTVDLSDPTKPYYATFVPFIEGAAGGAGGHAVSTFASTDTGAPAAGTVLSINVGAGGAPAAIDPRQSSYGRVYGSGVDGAVTINWTATTTSVDTPT